MTDHDVVFPAKSHQLLEQFRRGVRAGRHIGIVDPHQLHTAQIPFLQRLKVGLPPLLFQQVILHHLCPQQLRHRAIGGITGVGHQYRISEVEEGHRDMQDTLFRADQRQHLGSCQLHSVDTVIPLSVGSPQLRDTGIGLVGMHIGSLHCFTECLDGLLRWHPVRGSHRQADHIPPFGIHACYLGQLYREIILFNCFDMCCRFNHLHSSSHFILFTSLLNSFLPCTRPAPLGY